MNIISFSFRNHGRPKSGNYHVIDCRTLRNPHGEPALRALDGRDPRVRKFMTAHDGTNISRILLDASRAAKDGKNIAFGCFGGRHRSVCLAEMLAEWSATNNIEFTVQHTALEG